MLFDAGLAGLVFPREYGGQGLPPEYQRAYAEEAKDYEQAFIFQEPTLNILAPTLLDFGTEEQKRDHLPAILRGDERWVQFLSEPSSGSDVAEHDDQRHQGRRRLAPQRIEDLEQRRRPFRLGDVPGAHQLGRAEAPRADDVPRPDPTARYRRAPHPDGRWQRALLPGVPHRRLRRRRRRARRGRPRLVR